MRMVKHLRLCEANATPERMQSYHLVQSDSRNAEKRPTAVNSSPLTSLQQQTCAAFMSKTVKDSHVLISEEHAT